MKLKNLIFFALVCGSANAFYVAPPSSTQQSSNTKVFSTLDGTDAPSLDKSAIVAGPKDRLLEVAYDLKERFGVFIVDTKGQEDLRQAVEDLEYVAERPTFDEETKESLLGSWTLVCTTTSNKNLPSPLGSGIDTSKLPFFNQSPFKDIRESLNKCLVVQQAIYAKDSNAINRVDHVIEYQPPKTLQDLLDTFPSLDINPLDVTKGKTVLIHDADVENAGPGFSIRLKLASIVVNVAGTSQFLEPDGKDVLGINSPLKEFQSGTFETTYLDENLRISRTNMGSIDQLRVYVRSEERTTAEFTAEDDLDEEYFDEFDKFGQESEDGDDEEASAE